jgi:uncharacterized membrane protein YphA (DoxX/SURF4 family)
MFVGGIFFYASYDKILSPANFAGFVAQYELIPLVMVNWGSAVFAWTEFIISLLLIIGWLVRPAALISSVLLIFFICLMVYAGVTGAGFDCGCFPGDAGHPAGFDAAWRDLAFLLPSLLTLIYPGRLNIDAWRRRRGSGRLRGN